MLRVRSIIAALVVAGLAGPAFAAPRPQESWGRAGVTLEEYRRDAEECGRTVYYADISQNEHAQAFVTGTKRMEATDGMPLDFLALAHRYGQIQANTRTEWRLRELERGMQSVLEICLQRRGYVKFQLTEEQRDDLGHLKKGSPERHVYLHRLASDPAVLASQALISS
jgi:hypothetical protein